MSDSETARVSRSSGIRTTSSRLTSAETEAEKEDRERLTTELFVNAKLGGDAMMPTWIRTAVEGATLLLGEQTLMDAGLVGLTVNDRQNVLSRMREVLALRVGRRLSAGANYRELEDFDKAIVYGTEREIREKFESIVPADYEAIVEDELTIIVQEVRRAVRDNFASAQDPI